MVVRNLILKTCNHKNGFKNIKREHRRFATYLQHVVYYYTQIFSNFLTHTEYPIHISYHNNGFF